MEPSPKRRWTPLRRSCFFSSFAICVPPHFLFWTQNSRLKATSKIASRRLLAVRSSFGRYQDSTFVLLLSAAPTLPFFRHFSAIVPAISPPRVSGSQTRRLGTPVELSTGVWRGYSLPAGSRPVVVTFRDIQSIQNFRVTRLVRRYKGLENDIVQHFSVSRLMA